MVVWRDDKKTFLHSAPLAMRMLARFKDEESISLQEASYSEM